ncbi:hypothetical protein ACFOLM_17010 [Deinococcus soli (ex Cha et al. 2016)]|uniref:hypothetical protein n=1 Tax=Deinococcus soli (ex Cha et al. 2016) TaxID=1309411 RepID=UPI00360B41CF
MDAVFPLNSYDPARRAVPRAATGRTPHRELRGALRAVRNAQPQRRRDLRRLRTAELRITPALDFIDLPSLNLNALAGQTFTFPTNPEPGYIDGSIYFVGTHNPVDITRITFGTLTEHGLPVTFEGTWQMEFEASGFQDFETTIHTTLQRRAGTA